MLAFVLSWPSRQITEQKFSPFDSNNIVFTHRFSTKHIAGLSVWFKHNYLQSLEILMAVEKNMTLNAAYQEFYHYPFSNKKHPKTDKSKK